MKSAFTPGQTVEHVSLLELAELAEAGASTRGLLLAIFHHLAELCPCCGEELAPLLGRLQGETAGKSEEGFLAALLRAAWESSLETGDENWHALAEEMVRLSAEERDALWHCDARTQQLALGLALLELGESWMGGNAEGARKAAELVLTLVERRAAEPRQRPPGLAALEADQAAQAFALLAQLALLEKDAEAAAGPLLAARASADQGTGDPEVAAAVGMAEALLLWVRGEGEASLRAHERVARLWASAKEPGREAVVHARRATVLESLGRALEARQARALAASLYSRAGAELPPELWLDDDEPSGTRH